MTLPLLLGFISALLLQSAALSQPLDLASPASREDLIVDLYSLPGLLSGSSLPGGAGARTFFASASLNDLTERLRGSGGPAQLQIFSDSGHNGAGIETFR